MLRVLEPPPPGVMVQPVLLDYGDAGEEISWIGQERGLDNAKRILSAQGQLRAEGAFPRALPSARLSPAARRSRRRAAAAAADRGEALVVGFCARPSALPVTADPGPRSRTD
jgi:hypothetical protein